MQLRLAGEVDFAVAFITGDTDGDMELLTTEEMARADELTIADGRIEVRVRNLERVPTRAMQIDDIPENALPPRETGEPVAPVGAVPDVDPPVH